MKRGHNRLTIEQKGFFSFRLFILIVTIGVLIPVGYGFAARFYRMYGEFTAPQIEIVELPRGIGIAPVTLSFRVEDTGAGLDEVIVRTRQRGRVREMLRRKLAGAATFSEQIELLGSKSNFSEGVVDFEILAFDRAFWSNRGEKVLQLRVDYHKPKVEVLTTQHNARRGGSQLVFYRVFDEDVALSGVKVGNKVFQGFRASGLDSAFDDPNLYVAFYAIDINQSIQDLTVRAFAEDQAGNSASAEFYNKILDRPAREVTIVLTEDIMRGTVTRLFEQYEGRLSQAVHEIDGDPFLLDMNPLIKRFKLLNETLRRADQNDIRDTLAASPRFESFLKQFFLRQQATTTGIFNDNISYKYEDQVIGTAISLGTEFVFQGGQSEIVAVNDGIVVFADSHGTYGRTLAIDHGLGVASLYARLDNIKFHKGEFVKRGEVIGTIGTSGLAPKKAAYLEMRVHGVAVDPLEWWDANWFNQHVVGKIDDMKRALGLQVVKPL
jgi:murein DD-endopeptidase MepM/ murein hydrolase activator NlpD